MITDLDNKLKTLLLTLKQQICNKALVDKLVLVETFGKDGVDVSICYKQANFLVLFGKNNR
jgi:hypothetical protein